MSSDIPMIEMAGDDGEEEVTFPKRFGLSLPTDGSQISPRPIKPVMTKPQLSLSFIPSRLSDEEGEEDEDGMIELDTINENGSPPPDLTREGTIDGGLEAKFTKKKLALSTTTDEKGSGKRASYEVTSEGTLKTALYELRKTGFKRTTLLTKKLNRQAEVDESLSGLRREAFGKLNSSTLETIGVLGRGASGQVTRSLHVPTMTVVAVKSIDVTEKARRAQFIQELYELDTLDCPQIVEFLGAYYEEGHVFLALEFMNRGAMDSIIKSVATEGVGGRVPKTPNPLPAHKRLHEKVLSNAMKQILTGLDYLHSSNKIHRDIKPGNMLCNHFGEVKLSDFGLTSSVDPAKGRDSFVGTTIFMSPERINGSEYSLPSDIWSIGMSLLFMATGQPPINTDDGYWGIVININKAFDPKLDPTVFSANLIDFIMKCLAKEPENRWTCKQLLAHPFITEGPASIEETLPFWPKHLDMGIEKETGDFSHIVKSWKQRQLNRKASMKIKQSGQRGTILTHKVFKGDGIAEIEEEGIPTIMVGDQDQDGLFSALLSSKLGEIPHEVKRNHERILRRKHTRDEQILEQEKLQILREPSLDEVDEGAEDEFLSEEDKKLRKKIGFTMDELHYASSPNCLSGAASPARAPSPFAQSHVPRRSIHIADAMYMSASAAAQAAALYSITPEMSAHSSPRMSPLTIDRAASPYGQGQMMGSPAMASSGYGTPLGANSPLQQPRAPLGISTETASPIPPRVRHLRLASHDSSSAPGSPFQHPSPHGNGKDSPGQIQGTMTPKMEAYMYPAQPDSSSRSGSGTNTPRGRSNRHSRIVNGNLIVMERNAISSPRAQSPLAPGTPKGQQPGELESSPLETTVLSVTPLNALTPRSITPAGGTPNFHAVHTSVLNGSPSQSSLAIKLKKIALEQQYSREGAMSPISMGELSLLNSNPMSPPPDVVLSAVPAHLRKPSIKDGSGLPGGIISFPQPIEKPERHHQPILLKPQTDKSTLYQIANGQSGPTPLPPHLMQPHHMRRPSFDPPPQFSPPFSPNSSFTASPPAALSPPAVSPYTISPTNSQSPTSSEYPSMAASPAHRVGASPPTMQLTVEDGVVAIVPNISPGGRTMSSGEDATTSGGGGMRLRLPISPANNSTTTTISTTSTTTSSLQTSPSPTPGRVTPKDRSPMAQSHSPAAPTTVAGSGTLAIPSPTQMNGSNGTHPPSKRPPISPSTAATVASTSTLSPGSSFSLNGAPPIAHLPKLKFNDESNTGTPSNPTNSGVTSPSLKPSPRPSPIDQPSSRSPQPTYPTEDRTSPSPVLRAHSRAPSVGGMMLSDSPSENSGGSNSPNSFRDGRPGHRRSPSHPTMSTPRQPIHIHAIDPTVSSPPPSAMNLTPSTPMSPLQSSIRGVKPSQITAWRNSKVAPQITTNQSSLPQINHSNSVSAAVSAAPSTASTPSKGGLARGPGAFSFEVDPSRRLGRSSSVMSPSNASLALKLNSLKSPKTSMPATGTQTYNIAVGIYAPKPALKPKVKKSATMNASGNSATSALPHANNFQQVAAPAWNGISASPSASPQPSSLQQSQHQSRPMHRRAISIDSRGPSTPNSQTDDQDDGVDLLEQEKMRAMLETGLPKNRRMAPAVAHKSFVSSTSPVPPRSRSNSITAIDENVNDIRSLSPPQPPMVTPGRGSVRGLAPLNTSSSGPSKRGTLREADLVSVEESAGIMQHHRDHRASISSSPQPDELDELTPKYRKQQLPPQLQTRQVLGGGMKPVVSPYNSNMAPTTIKAPPNLFTRPNGATILTSPSNRPTTFGGKPLGSR